MVYENILLFRVCCDWTQEQVARALGISAVRYKKIERGTVTPSEKDLSKIADLYNVSVAELISGEIGFYDNVVMQFNDESVYKNFVDDEMVRMKLNELTKQEKQLILMFRASKQNKEIMQKLDELFEEM